MCIGIALRVSAPDGSFAWCEDGNTRERIDMMLVGDQPVGTWVLAFQGAARQVLSDEEAARSRAAREALAAALAGDMQLDRYFADLVSREPELPAHLLPVRALHSHAIAPERQDAAQEVITEAVLEAARQVAREAAR